MAPRKLGIDFDSLFPGKVVTIAGSQIEIKPLGLVKISSVVRKVRELGSIFADAGVSWENYNEPSSLFIIADVIMTASPSLMEELTDIDIEDIKQLPIDVVVELLATALEVNLQAKESLEKNFESLAGKMSNLIDQKPTRKQNLQK